MYEGLERSAGKQRVVCAQVRVPDENVGPEGADDFRVTGLLVLRSHPMQARKDN